MEAIRPDPVLTFVGLVAGTGSIRARKEFRRILDPEIRRYERLYRISVAASTPDLAVLKELTMLQAWREKIIGKKLRRYGHQSRMFETR